MNRHVWIYSGNGISSAYRHDGSGFIVQHCGERAQPRPWSVAPAVGQSLPPALRSQFAYLNDAMQAVEGAIDSGEIRNDPEYVI